MSGILYGIILFSNNGDELPVLIMSGNIDNNDGSAYVYSVRSSNDCADSTHFFLKKYYDDQINNYKCRSNICLRKTFYSILGNVNA